MIYLALPVKYSLYNITVMQISGIFIVCVTFVSSSWLLADVKFTLYLSKKKKNSEPSYH